MADNEALLKDIRETHDYFSTAWAPIRREGRRDVQILIEGPWDETERAKRQPETGPKRPCLVFPELDQYLNQAEGNIRQSKRAIKVDPQGNGANDATAELHQGMIRQIEYQSNAPEIYISAWVEMLRRSYGAFRIRRKKAPGKTLDQVLEVAPIRNPDSVLPDPDSKESDYSDMKRCFVVEPMKIEVFKRRFPKAQIKDFTSDHMAMAPKWIKPNDVLIAEYWKLEENQRTLVMFGDDYRTEYLDELPGAKMSKGNKGKVIQIEGQTYQVHKEGEDIDPKVTMYLTNGIEILEETPWTIEIPVPASDAGPARTIKGGRYIPIVFLTGKEVFFSKTDSGEAERYIFSLIRQTRDPLMLYCYARTCQAEALGQVPKSTHKGYVGQFEGQEDDWNELGTVPKGYVQFHGKTEEGGEQLLPPPEVIQWDPKLDRMEIAAEAARRGIQSAIGITGLSSGHPGQDTSARSGIALKTLAAQTYEGNYHFIDSYANAVKLAGRIIDDLIPVTYDTIRDQALRKPDDTQAMVRLHDPNFVDPQGQSKLLDTSVGDHQVTISTGPTQDSQRDAVDDFLNSIVSNEQIVGLALQNPQSTAAKLLAMAIKLKNLGPLGDQIADDVAPQKQQQIPPEVQAQMGQMQQKLEQATALVGHLQQELKEKTQMKTMELRSKERIAQHANVKDLAVVAIQTEHAGAIAFLENEMAAITKKLDMFHESELAPGPDAEGSPELGIHPEEIAPPAPPAGANGAAAQ